MNADLIIQYITENDTIILVSAVISAITGTLLVYGKAWGVIASKSAYLWLYVANEIGSLALLSAALLELATLSLHKLPRFQEAGARYVSRMLTACLCCAVLLAFVPLGTLSTIAQSHYFGVGFIGAGLGLIWAAFYLTCRYLRVGLDRRTAAEGSILAIVYIGYSVLLALRPAWLQIAVCVLWCLGFGLGAAISIFPRLMSSESHEPAAPCDLAASAKVRRVQARLDQFEKDFEVIGKG